MRTPLLIIVNGLPGSGKTTLARRLAADLSLPLFARDDLYETLYDAIECRAHAVPPSLLGPASFALLYNIAGAVLAAGQPVIVDGFFGRADLRRAEFLALHRRCDFEPLEILCKAEGSVLLQRFLARIKAGERHGAQRDLEWLKENEPRLLQGDLMPLALGGHLIECDTTTAERFDYADIARRVGARL